MRSECFRNAFGMRSECFQNARASLSGCFQDAFGCFLKRFRNRSEKNPKKKMPEFSDAPADCYYVVLVQHNSEHICSDHRIITKSFERAERYGWILRTAYESLHEPYVPLCNECHNNQCQIVVKLMHSASIWVYDHNMIYYQDLYYEDGLCNAGPVIDFRDSVRQAIIRHGGECLVSPNEQKTIRFEN